MSLRICEVNADNWQTIALLSVNEEQTGYIESNSFSIAQSIFEPHWTSAGLYEGDEAVGYAMYGYDPGSGDVWLDRFMVDRHFQGKGYASKFLPMLIAHIEKKYNCDTLFLSISPDNQVAQKLYEKYGFRLNGEEDHTGVISGLTMVLHDYGQEYMRN
ncbi:GNAT family N-acetyltransferase [Bacillus sp. 1P06AnD]|uniref:GNAT family N-acetyltransferase n=1 Tax=Bacillus sp. 1P06AnD TaxID=3132208 RepID=UPI0039A071B9